MEGERIFARVRAFDVSCPRCGRIERVGVKGVTWKGAWNPRNCRWRCKGCGKVYYVGLILWDPAKGGHQRPPDDTTPNEREAAILRSRLNVWGREKRSSRQFHSLLGPRVNRVAVGDPLEELRAERSERALEAQKDEAKAKTSPDVVDGEGDS